MPDRGGPHEIENATGSCPDCDAPLHVTGTWTFVKGSWLFESTIAHPLPHCYEWDAIFDPKTLGEMASSIHPGDAQPVDRESWRGDV